MADGGDADGTGGMSASGHGLGPRLRAFWANPGYRFVAFFLPYLAIASVLYPRFALQYRSWVQGAIEGTARVLYWMFALFTNEIGLSRKLLSYDGFVVTIVDECTGIYEVIIFTAAVLAFPTSLRNKLVGLVAGNALIYLFNLVRIVFLILVGRYFPAIFEFMHIYFWQATMILMIASVWLLWLIKVVRRAKPRPSAGV